MFPGSVQDSFSPYLDPEPWADYFDDFARRHTTALFLAFIVHIFFFILLQPSFVIPDLIDDPEAINVQIVAFEDTAPPPEPETAPPPDVIRPAIAPPPPSIRPKPKPAPPPPPIPVETEPEPDIKPVFTPPPPAPEILSQAIDSPDALPVADPVPPPLPEPVIEPRPEPQVEIFDPQPLPEPLPPPQPVPDPIIDPLPAPEPTPVPDILPDPVYSQEPPGEWRPYIPPQPEALPPAAGAIVEPLPDLPDLDTLPPVPVDIPPDIVPETASEPPALPPVQDVIPLPEPTPELEAEDELVITTAPTILASPEAPVTREEADLAVPQSQATPLDEFLRNDQGSTNRVPRGQGRPETGLGSPAPVGGISRRPGAAITGTPSGGTRRSNPGAGGWTLAAPTRANIGAGYKGLNLDIRCREAGRTHADCPKYLKQFQGRNAAGFESFSAHNNSGSKAPVRRGVHTTGNRSPHTSNPWNSSLGDNSINAGGPSTTVLNDTTFSHGFQGIGAQDIKPQRSVRDLFRPPDRPWNGEVILLPSEPPLGGTETDENEGDE